MKSITIDTEEDIVLLVGKVIGRFKKGVFGVPLLSYVTDDEFNQMSMFDVSRFAVEKENFIRTIYDSSHPCPNSIQ